MLDTAQPYRHILRLEEFSPHSSSPPPPHLQIYTWPTCTLSELTSLLLTALPSLLPTPAVGTRLAFRLIFPDTRESARPGPGRYLHKDLGSVVVGAGGPGVRGEDGGDGDNATAPSAAARDLEGDAEKSLQGARFVIGDYISCAILPPLADGGVAALPAPTSGFAGRSGGYGPSRAGLGPRENGYGPSPSHSGGGYGRPRGGRMGYESRGGGVPAGEWRRGEIPSGPPTGVYGRGRGRGRPY